MNSERRARPLALGLMVLGAVMRLLPHAPNFTPVGAMSIFAGARLRGWQAFLLPLILMAVTDPLLGGYSAATPLVYTAFVVNVCIGRYLRNTESPVRIGAAALLGSVQFFVLTNFAWLGGAGNLYPHTLAGIVQCYIDGLPFFGRTLAADLVYSGLLFGLHAWLSRTVYRPERIAATA